MADIYLMISLLQVATMAGRFDDIRCYRLLQWLVDEEAPQQLRTDAAIIMGSIAKGTTENINTLVEEGCVTVLLKCKSQCNLLYIIVEQKVHL